MAPNNPVGTWFTRIVLIFPLAVTGVCYEGSAFDGGLVSDARGNLYTAALHGGPRNISGGIIFGAGTISQLNPTLLPYGGIYSFTGGTDGAYPTGDLVILKSGLYGTTSEGGLGFGTVFWLKPPSVVGGSWTESVLHTFIGGADGSNPVSGLLAFQGAFFGTTTQGGAANAGTVYVVKP